jgi:hypothetical protein
LLGAQRSKLDNGRGVSATAGVFALAGDLDGWLIALDAQSGHVVREIDTGEPTGAGIVTYEAAERQYIAVAGGTISPIWPPSKSTRRMSFFRLH